MADIDGTTYGGGDMFASSPTQSARVTSVEQWARDLILVTFAQPMQPVDALGDADSYTVTPLDGGDDVMVREVMVPSTAKDYVFLVISRPTVGAKYAVAASEALLSSSAIALSPLALSGKFLARDTKVDVMVWPRPLFSKDNASTVRQIMNAIAHQDDLLGGSRDDDYP